jgi:hypothetical protein
MTLRTKKTTKLVQGHVAEVQNGQSATGRSQCFDTSDFDFGEGVLEMKKLYIRSVKLGPPLVAANSDVLVKNPQNSESNAANAIEAAAASLNNAGNTTINRPSPIAPAAPSNSPLTPSNSPPASSETTYNATTTATPVGTTPPTADPTSPQPASALPVSENDGTRWLKLEHKSSIVIIPAQHVRQETPHPSQFTDQTRRALQPPPSEYGVDGIQAIGRLGLTKRPVTSRLVKGRPMSSNHSGREYSSTRTCLVRTQSCWRRSFHP